MLHEVLEHSLEDSIKILPFLFLTYLMMEYIQHKIGKRSKDCLQKLNCYGPAVGSILGILPQCGFSSVASNFYTGRIITLGTLIAVYLATSDEMLPVMISSGADTGLILKILFLKAIVGCISGMTIDYVIRRKKNAASMNTPKMSRTKQQLGDENEAENDFVFTVYRNEKETTCYCGKKGGIILAAVRHSLSTFLFLFLITVILMFVMHEFGEAQLEKLILNQPFLGEILAGMIGLIPNCAASVVLTELYLGNAMTFSALMSGLFAGSGVGILVLFRENRKNWRENLKILSLLYGIAVAAGWLIMLIL